MMHLDTEALTAGVPGRPTFWVRHRQGRTIHAPNQHAHDVHVRMLEQIRAQASDNAIATAKPGSSPLANARQHLGHRYFVIYDLREAFPSVRGEWLRECFDSGEDAQLSLLDDERLRAFLQKYCLLPKAQGLRTGGPASVDLFNLIGRQRLDFALGQYCAKRGITYTRYIDDLVFSCNEPIGAHARSEIRRLIRTSAFSSGRHKTQMVDLERQKTVTITGVGITHTGRVFMPRPQLRKTEAVLRRALRDKSVSAKVVKGHIGYFRSFYPSDAQLNRTEQRVDNLCRQYLKQPKRQPQLHFRTREVRSQPRSVWAETEALGVT